MVEWSEIIVGAIAGSTATFVFQIIREKLKQRGGYEFTLQKYFENGNQYIRIQNYEKTIEKCIILCDENECEWWDKTKGPRHINRGGGANALIPIEYRESSAKIIIKANKRKLKTMRLYDIIQTQP